MKVLWITNDPLPEALGIYLGNMAESCGTGSWVVALSGLLSKSADVEMYVASPCHMVKTVQRLEGESICHFLVPVSASESEWRSVYEAVGPQVVHIHGTEYPHALTWIRACGADHTVVSLQGLVSRCAERYDGGISRDGIRRMTTLRDIVRMDTHTMQKRNMARRGEVEETLLKSVHHVIGRTAWDKKEVLSINPDIHYHHCGEALRPDFYKHRWRYADSVPGRIFLSQGHYPLKGFHQLLAAMPAILKAFPDANVHVAGPDIIRSHSKIWRVWIAGYGKYLRILISRNGLDGKVKFLGPLNASGIIDELLASNVFVLASSIENSPNSLGEAQVLGVPCVASRVGGVPDMIPDPQSGSLYEFGDVNGITEAIIRALESAPVFDSEHEMSVAAARHDEQKIVDTLVNIYSSL